MKIEECEIGMEIVLGSGHTVKITEIDELDSDHPVCLMDSDGQYCWVDNSEVAGATPKREITEAFRKEQYFAIMRDVIARRVSSVSISAETDTIAKCALNSLDTAIDYWEKNK